jgi:nucleoside-diphosphate-sugar epimerase
MQSRRRATELRVLVLGGTGSIGSAVVQELTARGHAVLGLARTELSEARLRVLGATAIAGDIAAPEVWIGKLPRLDAVVHMACGFGPAMGAIDHHLLDILLPALAAQPVKPSFIYTGGCWLFGATDGKIATEETPFNPLQAFAWMVPNLTRLLSSPQVDGIVIHPAMVYTADGGVFRHFARDAIERVRLIGSEQVRWPLVHSADLANLYALALERAPARSSYIGAAIDGLAVGARFREAVRTKGPGAANHFGGFDRRRTWRVGEAICARPAAQRREGATRARLVADASRSDHGDRNCAGIDLTAPRG